jgi:hypothetical protein
VETEAKCPICGEPVIELHKSHNAWGGETVRKTVTYECSSGKRHIPWGWKPENA